MSKFAYDREVQNWIGKRFLETLLPLLACLIVFVTAVAPFAMPEEFGRIAWSFCYLPGLAVCFWLVRRGYVRLVVALTTLAMLQAITFAMLFYGGVRSPVYVGGMTALCLAVWYYPRRMAVLIWGYLVVLGALFVGIEKAGWLPAGPEISLELLYTYYAAYYTIALAACLVPAHMLQKELQRRKAQRQEAQALAAELQQRERDNEGLIAELQRTGQALVQREAKLREAQHIAKLGYWSRDVVTDEMYWSEEMFTMAGIAQQPVTPALLLQVLHPEDHGRVLDHAENSEGRETARELRFVRPDGEVRWLADKWWSEFDADGREATRCGVAQDITEHKQSELLLEAEAKLSRALLDAPNIGRVLGVCLDAAIEASGLDCGGIYTERPDGGLRLACHRGCTPAFLAEMREMPPEHPSVQVVRAGQPVYANYCEMTSDMTEAQRAEGLEGIAVIPILYNGRVIGCLNCASHRYTSIPEHARRSLEIIANQIGGALLRANDREQLEFSEARFRQIIETSRDIIWEAHVSGKYLYISPRIYDILGYRPEELLGRRAFEFMAPESVDTAKRTLESAVQSGSGWEKFVMPFLHKDGTPRWVESNSVPVLGPSGKVDGFRGVDRDVTDRVRAEEEKAEAEKKYLRAQRMEAVGQLAGGVAHDFNNMLQGFTGACELALEDIEVDHKVRPLLEESLKESSRAARLVEQLLTFSRRQIMKPKMLVLNRVVEDLLKMVRRLIGENIALEWQPSQTPCVLQADLSMIEQLLMNLCINARDAMPEGGELHISTRMLWLDEDYCRTQEWARPGPYAVLQVRDTGCGIAPEVMPKLFEPFFSTKPFGEGTGLGLATVYGIVRQHEGMIFPRSHEGAGALFEIYLPAFEAQLEQEEAPAPRQAEEPSCGDETILLAEDNEGVRKVAAIFLRRAGYTVFEAEDGREAIEILQEKGDSIQFALLDVVMPRLGGREVYDYLSEHHPDVPVLFATGYTEDGIHTGFVLEQGLTLLNKPFDRITLLRAVRARLDAPREDPPAR